MKRRFLLLLLLLTGLVTSTAIVISQLAARGGIERLILERAKNHLSIIVWGFSATSTDVDVYSYVEFDHEVLSIKKDGFPIFQYGTARLDPDSPTLHRLERHSGSYDFSLSIDLEAELAKYMSPVRMTIGITAAVYTGLFLVFGWIFVGMVADPISRLAAAMVTITSRNLRRRIPIPRRHDEIRQLIVTFNDMLDEISGTYERQAQFVEEMTHDIVTPVQILEGYRQLVERHGKREDLVDEFLGAAKVELGRLRDMSGQLKAALAAEKVRRVERADATAITERNVAYYRALFPHLRFEAQIEANVSLPIEPSDLNRIEHVLVDNAVKYGGDGGRISISLKPGQLCVRDFGAGIAEEDIPLVFDRYHRGRGAETRDEGTGIGLAILKKFSEEYHFDIRLESRKGEGCAFTLVFKDSARAT